MSNFRAETSLPRVMAWVTAALAGTRLKKAIEAGSLIIVSVAFSLAIAEFILRLFYPLEIHKFSDRTHASFPVRIHFHQNLPKVKSDITLTTNQFGFRALSMSTKLKPQGKTRVLCLGASTTLSETQDTGDIWCALLEKMLATRGLNIETAAFGSGGWLAANLLDWTVHNARDYDPDVVIIMMGINDLAWAGGPGWRSIDIDKILLENHRQPRVVFIQECAEWLYLCRIMAAAQTTWMADTGHTLDWHSEMLPVRRAQLLSYPEVPAPRREPDPIENFSAAMDKLVAHLTAAHIDVLVLGQPVLWSANLSTEEKKLLWFPVETAAGSVRVDPGWLDTEMERYNERQQEIALGHGAAYLDLDGIIPKNGNYFFDDCHYTDLGNKAVALAILPKLLQILQNRGDVSGKLIGDAAR